MSDPVTKPFWVTYRPASRLGWTALALLPMWAIAGIAFVACCVLVAAVCAAIVITYPLMHFVWGMQGADQGGVSTNG